MSGRAPCEGSFDRPGPQSNGQRETAAQSNAAPTPHRAHAIAIARTVTAALAAVSSLEACSTPALPCGHHVAGASLGQVSNKPRRVQSFVSAHPRTACLRSAVSRQRERQRVGAHDPASFLRTSTQAASYSEVDPVASEVGQEFCKVARHRDVLAFFMAAWILPSRPDPAALSRERRFLFVYGFRREHRQQF